MRLTKKKVFVSALAVCLIAILSAGSLAWFSATDEVTNKFLIATSEDDTPEEIFSVDVWEEVGVDEDGDGNPDKIGKDEEGNGHTYKDILPGATYTKEPHVENTGYYDQFIRVIVTVSDASAWQTVHGVSGGTVVPLTDIVKGYDATMWSPTGANLVNGNFQYVLYYTGKLASGEDVKVFEEVVIPTTLTQEQAVEFGGDFTIDIVAQAVQTENVGNSAYEAFQKVGMGIN